MKVSELKKLLRKHGCKQDGEYTEHDRWYSPLTDKYFAVPRHNSKEIPVGTANRILKDAGLK